MDDLLWITGTWWEELDDDDDDDGLEW